MLSVLQNLLSGVRKSHPLEVRSSKYGPWTSSISVITWELLGKQIQELHPGPPESDPLEWGPACWHLRIPILEEWEDFY